MKLKIGDQVIVITGKDKNQTGHIKKIKSDRVLVEGVNLKKHHLSKDKHGKSTIEEKESMVHISNVAYYDGAIHSKIGYKLVDGKKTRFMRKNKKEIGGRVNV